jgi:hypothetical protein
MTTLGMVDKRVWSQEELLAQRSIVVVDSVVATNANHQQPCLVLIVDRSKSWHQLFLLCLELN